MNDGKPPNNISYPASSASVVFGRRLSARFPCPAGQEIARSPPLRVASYVTANILSSLETFLGLDNFLVSTVSAGFESFSFRQVFRDLCSCSLRDFRGLTSLSRLTGF